MNRQNGMNIWRGEDVSNFPRTVCCCCNCNSANSASEKAIFFSSSGSVTNNSWIGQGTTSDDFFQNSIVLPQNSTVKKIILSTRNNTLSAGDSVTASAYVNVCGEDAQTASVISATANANTGCNVSATGNYTQVASSLLSIQITTVPTDLSLDNGVAVTVLFE